MVPGNGLSYNVHIFFFGEEGGFGSLERLKFNWRINYMERSSLNALGMGYKYFCRVINNNNSNNRNKNA